MKRSGNLVFCLVLCILATACQPQNTPATTPVGMEVTEAAPEPTATQTISEPAATQHTAVDMAGILEELGGEPCPDGSRFTCVTLSLPLDHFDPANASTIDVVFAVQPAGGERKGMFVTVVGGPGSSGLASADSYTDMFQPGVTEKFDIVFFDIRGMGASGGLQCSQATAAYYLSEVDVSTPEGQANLMEAAQTFVNDCVNEMEHPEWLPYISTRQAIEDLEAFRQIVGDEKMWLYGESYGTQFSQTYAEFYSQHLAGLILDGTVDLTLDGLQFMGEQTQDFENTLLATLEAWNEDESCPADMGGDALEAYDALAQRLAEAPIPYSYPLPSGSQVERTFTLSDLEAAAAGYLYGEGARMILLRSLASAAQGDIVPLARMLYEDLGVDPESLQAIEDPTWSDAIYYAIECNDYTYAAQGAEAYLEAGEGIERFSSIFYGDLPCAYWPVGENEDANPRPPLLAEGVTTLVLNASADPATPPGNGEAVFSRLADGYMVMKEGGPHIIFGRGESCPDDLVTAFLVDDALPEQRENTCEGYVVEEYWPLASRQIADYENVLKIMMGVDDEIYYLPEYYYWDLVTPLHIGCPLGGTLSVESSKAGEDWQMQDCTFISGFSLSGSGVYDWDADVLTLEVSVTGEAVGSLTYVRDSYSTFRVTGDYAGSAVDLSE